MTPSKGTGSAHITRFEGAALRLISDDRLSRLAAGGDRKAFAAIFDRYHQDLYNYCASILRNREDAADAVQNTMLRAMRALEGEERKIAVRPWLYRIAHNESITLLRRPRTESADDAEVSTIDDVETTAAVRARLRTILADIAELPDRQRSALVMREMSGLGYDEIAEALATTADGAKQAVYDARQALHERAMGRDSACDTIRHKLSAGDRRVFRGRAIRAHLTACSDCRSFQATMVARESSLAAFAPAMPAAAAATILPGAVGGGAGAAAGFAGLGATATGPALATMAVAVALGAGAIGVHELTDDDESAPSARTPAQVAAKPAAERKAAASSRKRGERKAATTSRGRGDSKTRAQIARERARRRRESREGRSGGNGGEGRNGPLAGAADGDEPITVGPGVRSGGGRSNGVRSWLGPGGSPGNGSRPGGGQGPVRTGVGDTRDAVAGTVNQVQDALPVPTPELPIGRPPEGQQPKR